VNASAVSDIPTDFHAYTSNVSAPTTHNDEPSFASADPFEIGSCKWHFSKSSWF